MAVIDMLLLIVACACFALAAFDAAVTRVNLTALGLLLFALVPTIAAVQAVAG